MLEHASAILGQENDHVIRILIKAAVANFTSLLILATLKVRCIDTPHTSQSMLYKLKDLGGRGLWCMGVERTEGPSP